MKYQTDILEKLERIQQPFQNSSSNTGTQSSDAANQTISNRQLQTATWNLLNIDAKFVQTMTDSATTSQNEPTRDLDDSIQQALLKSLLYENLNYREEAISDVHAKTFEWIFHEPQLNEEGYPAWSSFSNWLENDSTDIYWITGKPGAGKSTLIKFILEHCRTVQCLRKWASSSPPIVLGYYFWAAGSDLQKSHEGLLRALLWKALRTRPDLIPKVLLARWTMMKLHGQDVNLPKWSVNELRKAFRQLATEITKKDKLALIIDGLDEFSSDHRSLVQLIKDLSTLPHVKICVSSRPWNIFRDEFSCNPSLSVENLTRGDIQLYVEDHFSGSKAFHELHALQPETTKIVKDIVDKARGVFLWVKIVVTALLEGLSDGDTLPDLQETIDELPEDLSQLFQAIWDRIDSNYHEDASQLFQIMEVASKYHWGLSAFALWLGDEHHTIETSRDEIKSINRKLVILNMRRRLSSRTKGLLEVHDGFSAELGQRVDYMHRSVKDWVWEQTGQLKLSSKPDFDPWLTLLKGLTLQISSWDEFDEKNIKFWTLVSQLFAYASYVEEKPCNMSVFFSVLDRIDMELTRLVRMSLAYKRLINIVKFGEDHPPNSRWVPHGRGVDQVKNHLPHWSSLQFQSEEGLHLLTSNATLETTFIGFAAQIPLTSYVRDKILSQRGLLYAPNRKVMDPAEVMIFNVGFGNTDHDINPLMFELRLKKKEERLELFRFLLEQGASSSRLKAMLQGRDSDLAVRYWPVEELWKETLLRTIKKVKGLKGRTKSLLYKMLQL